VTPAERAEQARLVSEAQAQAYADRQREIRTTLPDPDPWWARD